MNLSIISDDICKNNSLKLSKETILPSAKITGYYGWESRYIPTKRTFQKIKQNK